jgi:5'-deoxynucleotidase YfbR-like HD superfamily hydrolase
MKSGITERAEFVLAALDLKEVSREGWHLVGITDVESVADHTYGLLMLAYVLSHSTDLDTERLLKMALVHDLPETRTGDIAPSRGVTAEQKMARESSALREITENLPANLRDEIRDLWLDYERGESPESRFVRQLDKIEMAMQALRYERGFTGQAEELDTFWISTRKVVGDERLREVLDHLTRLRASSV